jgi:hypothetical protein
VRLGTDTDFILDFIEEIAAASRLRLDWLDEKKPRNAKRGAELRKRRHNCPIPKQLQL